MMAKVAKGQSVVAGSSVAGVARASSPVQFLGVIWIGVLLVLAFLAWVSVNLVRWQERAFLSTLRDRQTSYDTDQRPNTPVRAPCVILNAR
jgi:hypothetical protein